jgi:hypothetical protein
MIFKKTLFSLMVCFLLNPVLSQPRPRFPRQIRPNRQDSLPTEDILSLRNLENIERGGGAEEQKFQRELSANSGTLQKIIQELESEAGFGFAKAGGVQRQEVNKGAQLLKQFQHKSHWGPCCWRGMTWNAREKFCVPFGLGRVGCQRQCGSNRGNTSCGSWRPVLCINRQHIDRPNYRPRSPHSKHGWSGSYLATTMRIPGCWFFWIPWIGDWLCRIQNAGNCWRMATNTDGYYFNRPQQPLFCAWDFNDFSIRQGTNSYYGHGDLNGRLNQGEYWIKHNQRGKNCWDWQNTCWWGQQSVRDTISKSVNTSSEDLVRTNSV